MTLSESDRRELDTFPAVLRALLEAELAAGNEIVELGHGFPAPPVGAYVKLARPVTTRPRESAGELDFFDRNGSDYAGEFTDNRRFFFLLEPPHPPPPEPDMDAIRARLAQPSPAPAPPPDRGRPDHRADVARPGAAAPNSPLERFVRSMNLDYEKWREGVGYDLEALRAASVRERKAIEQQLLEHQPRGWRDVEALAALDSPEARRALKASMKDPNAEVRMAVVRHAPQLVPARERLASLLKALETAQFYGGLTEALAEVEEHHPPEVVEALLRGALNREGDGAPHFAAMLMFLHGKAPVPFDWEQRPFFLRFNTADRAEREAAFRELCAKIGVDAAPYLKPKPPRQGRGRNG